MAYASFYAEPHLDDERAIVDRLIRKALELGYTVGVHDGEELALSRSSDYEAITSRVAMTDETHLIFRLGGTLDQKLVGKVYLVHGNGEDVVSDHSDNELTGDLVAHATGEDFRP